MTDFTNLAALVAQGQALLDLVKGGHITQLEADSAAKLGEVDTALALKIAQANADIANATKPVNEQIPRICLSKNQRLAITSGTVPDNFAIHVGSTSTLLHTVNKGIGIRTVEAQVLLDEIEAEIIEQYLDFKVSSGELGQTFNVVRIAWDITGFDGSEDIFALESVHGERIRQADEITFACLVKLESGTLDKTFSIFNNHELGKWRFSKKYQVFGDTMNPYVVGGIKVTSATGSMLIALPVVTTGRIEHPNDIFRNVRVD
jgi:hypothetical protein